MRVRRALGSFLVIFAALGESASAEHSPHFDAECPTGTAQIVLDPGHGGPDPGAVDEQIGLYERDVALEIATRAAEILREQGYTVALTRDDNATELGNSERGEIANACQALVLVEIHLNGSTDPEINYSQAFWGEKEKDLALSLTMSNALTSLHIPLAGVDRFDNGGLLRAKMPSVLVEAVFLTNPDEAKKLANGTGTRQDEIAQAIANGIAAWMELQD
ncbi:MAG TPA: N-acetylmuramoyl-L-alanine amidase [Thermomicrobiales bacterium]|nr:N-acetylmuramoyl-L-alanine amidase [Thermomicrobiales bacterium]